MVNKNLPSQGGFFRSDKRVLILSRMRKIMLNMVSIVIIGGESVLFPLNNQPKHLSFAKILHICHLCDDPLRSKVALKITFCNILYHTKNRPCKGRPLKFLYRADYFTILTNA